MKDKTKSEELTKEEKLWSPEEKQMLKSVKLKYDQKKKQEQSRDDSGLSEEGRMYWAVNKMSNSLVWNDGYLQKENTSPKKNHDALFDIH